VVTHYIWEGGQVIAEYVRGGGATQATGIRYYHQGHLSTRIMTNGAGAVVGTTDHLPFGEEIGVSGEGEKHKFTTYERDTTGLDYAVNRHYDPQRGRFNQADPLGMGAASLADPQTLNLYGYVRNNPVNSVDPLGLQESPTCLIDGIPASCSLAFGLVRSGAGMIGPLNTTRWDPGLNQGKGGFWHFRFEADGKAGWGHWEEVTERAVDDADNELWSYTYKDWHWDRTGKLTIYDGQLGVLDGSGMIRNLNGGILKELPIEMLMLGPLDFVGVGELKAGAAILATLVGVGIAISRKSTVNAAAKALLSGSTEVAVNSQDEAAELFMALFQSRGYRNTTGMTGNTVINDRFLFPDGKYGTYHWDFA
jgi:RHS repeat-associated protein